MNYTIFDVLKAIKTYISECKPSNYGECILSPIDKDNSPKGDFAITLLRIEEETSRKPQSVYEKVEGELKIKKKINPSIYINLYILISTHADNYETALKEISDVIYWMNNFQNDKILIELQSLSAEQFNSMWQTLGGKLAPCAVYKIRMVEISSESKSDVDPIDPKGIRQEISHKENQ